MHNETLIWLGAAYGLTAPGSQASFRVTRDSETATVLVVLTQEETDAIASHLGQAKLEKRQAELILQHAGRELIDSALQAFELPDEVRVRTTDATRHDDLRRWHVVR